ncbi:MAG: segregation/condensation protein A, partial [Candidatus Atribacteria bacterium]|nr:segregation/condensation protein A [Candidatus Atribacteria bacterium]
MINNHGKLEKDKIVELTDYVQQLCLEVKNEEKDLEGVSLFKIVEQFLTYIILLQPEQIDLDITANFLMSVSILILWKSNLLLPSNQEE